MSSFSYVRFLIEWCQWLWILLWRLWTERIFFLIAIYSYSYTFYFLGFYKFWVGFILQFSDWCKVSIWEAVMRNGPGPINEQWTLRHRSKTYFFVTPLYLPSNIMDLMGRGTGWALLWTVDIDLRPKQDSALWLKVRNVLPQARLSLRIIAATGCYPKRWCCCQLRTANGSFLILGF